MAGDMAIIQDTSFRDQFKNMMDHLVLCCTVSCPSREGCLRAWAFKTFSGYSDETADFQYDRTVGSCSHFVHSSKQNQTIYTNTRRERIKSGKLKPTRAQQYKEKLQDTAW